MQMLSSNGIFGQRAKGWKPCQLRDMNLTFPITSAKSMATNYAAVYGIARAHQKLSMASPTKHPIPGRGGGGGVLKRKLIRGAPPEVRPLTLLYNILGRNDTPFVHLTLENNERPF